MTHDEFNLIANNGALAHPSMLLRVTRAYLCLFHLIQSVPGVELAFIEWCKAQDQQDELEQ